MFNILYAIDAGGRSIENLNRIKMLFFFFCIIVLKLCSFLICFYNVSFFLEICIFFIIEKENKAKFKDITVSFNTDNLRKFIHNVPKKLFR